MLGLEKTLGLGVMLLCYTGVLMETLGPRGTATLLWLRWLGPRGDAGPRGAATLLHGYAGWGLEGTLDLGVLLHCWAATLAGASRRRWTSGYCYTAVRLRFLGPRGDAGPRGTATLGGLEETLASRGRWCHWAPRGRQTSGDACDAGLEETLPAGAGAGLSKMILGAHFSLSLVRLLK